jgi:DNA-binding transcriptional MocR family regulator
MAHNRPEPTEHFTKMIRNHMELQAWRELSTTAQAIYPFMKLEWKGPKANNNGKIEISARQLAMKIGVTRTTAANALHDLQRKGWIFVTKKANLGLAGQARGNLYELTEIALPGDNPRPRNLFRDWSPGHDLDVAQIRTNNPKGFNGK